MAKYGRHDARNKKRNKHKFNAKDGKKIKFKLVKSDEIYHRQNKII